MFGSRFRSSDLEPDEGDNAGCYRGCPAHPLTSNVWHGDGSSGDDGRWRSLVNSVRFRSVRSFIGTA
eukprot:10203580-Alexandrium_andersonii.AAC.1